jgi:ubiquinone/menaquinone biosynthesis C-methylase UbiE
MHPINSNDIGRHPPEGGHDMPIRDLPAGSARTYRPAAGFDWFLPLYDPLMRLLGGDGARRALLDQSTIRPGDRILEVGSGTGTLVVLIKRLHPDVVVVGIDADPKALARARRKAEREGIAIQLDCGFSDQLPYAAASFDLVFSSLMFHHLPPAEIGPTLREIRRVLKPDGALHFLDLARYLPADHLHALMSEAGLGDPQTVGERSMRFMRLAYHRASVARGPVPYCVTDSSEASPDSFTAAAPARRPPAAS